MTDAVDRAVAMGALLERLGCPVRSGVQWLLRCSVSGGRPSTSTSLSVGQKRTGRSARRAWTAVLRPGLARSRGGRSGERFQSPRHGRGRRRGDHRLRRHRRRPELRRQRRPNYQRRSHRTGRGRCPGPRHCVPRGRHQQQRPGPRGRRVRRRRSGRDCRSGSRRLRPRTRWWTSPLQHRRRPRSSREPRASRPRSSREPPRKQPRMLPRMLPSPRRPEHPLWHPDPAAGRRSAADHVGS